MLLHRDAVFATHRKVSPLYVKWQARLLPICHCKGERGMVNNGDFLYQLAETRSREPKTLPWLPAAEFRSTVNTVLDIFMHRVRSPHRGPSPIMTWLSWDPYSIQQELSVSSYNCIVRRIIISECWLLIWRGSSSFIVANAWYTWPGLPEVTFA